MLNIFQSADWWQIIITAVISLLSGVAAHIVSRKKYQVQLKQLELSTDSNQFDFFKKRSEYLEGELAQRDKEWKETQEELRKLRELAVSLQKQIFEFESIMIEYTAEREQMKIDFAKLEYKWRWAVETFDIDENK